MFADSAHNVAASLSALGNEVGAIPGASPVAVATGVVAAGLQGAADLRDRDHDGLTDGEERVAHTNRNDPDTDGDKLPDGAEVHIYKTNPNATDTDHDGRSDLEEAAPTITYDGDTPTYTYNPAPTHAAGAATPPPTPVTPATDPTVAPADPPAPTRSDGLIDPFDTSASSEAGTSGIPSGTPEPTAADPLGMAAADATTGHLPVAPDATDASASFDTGQQDAGALSLDPPAPMAPEVQLGDPMPADDSAYSDPDFTVGEPEIEPASDPDL